MVRILLYPQRHTTHSKGQQRYEESSQTGAKSTTNNSPEKGVLQWKLCQYTAGSPGQRLCSVEALNEDGFCCIDGLVSSLLWRVMAVELQDSEGEASVLRVDAAACFASVLRTHN